MKLLRVKFDSFRLLKNVVINFSTDDVKKLTVIRADNGTGKTTAMAGLIWGLYGSKFVKEKLYPLPDFADGQLSFNISVTIDFKTEVTSTVRGNIIVEEKVYRLKRSCTESVSSNGKSFTRSADQVGLTEQTDTGSMPVDDQIQIQQVIERTLPAHLKDIYFTDGDKALSFIESVATDTEKRSRVKGAIEALLSMKEVSSSLKTLNNIKLGYARSVDKAGQGSQLLAVEESISNLTIWAEGAKEEVEELTTQKRNVEDEIKETDKKIEKQLKLGDKEELTKELHLHGAQLVRVKKTEETSLQELSRIINSEDISIDLIREKLGPAIDTLNRMDPEDNFPKQYLPVLREILRKEKCLCGADVSEHTDAGAHNIERINTIILETGDLDKINSQATQLYSDYSDRIKTHESNWMNDYATVSSQYMEAGNSLREYTKHVYDVQRKIDEINDEGLQSLRAHRRALIAERDDHAANLAIAESEYDRHLEQLNASKLKAQQLSLVVDKSDSAGQKHQLASYLINAYSSVFEKLKQEQLQKVSRTMNGIFMAMIGASLGEQDLGMIRRSELTEDYDIKVFGPNNQPLNPDTELNGASRRAISLAFILALTKESEVEATNVIDTPLGMTSGLVRASILEELISTGSQIVLFLTFDEIKGVETILDQYAGSSMTMSFSGHYPRMLKNKPADDGVTVVCDCDHNQCCSVCERHDQPNMSIRSQG